MHLPLTHAPVGAFEIAGLPTCCDLVNKATTRKMADDFVLNSALSAFLDDYHEIPSELDASVLSPKEIETQVNRTHIGEALF